MAVADHGGLSAVARAEGLAPSTVSLALKRLEDQLRIRLVQRSTRRLSLTAEGERFLVDCRRILSDYREATEALSDGGRLQGDIRLTVPNDVGRTRIAPLIDAFMCEHKAVRVSLMLTDRVVDLIEEGFDVGVRAGQLLDSRLVAKLLVRGQRNVCAAPAYWRRAGRPQTPRDLADHNCMVLARPGAPQSSWRFRDGDRSFSVRVIGDRTANDGGTLRAWAISGAGVILKSSFDIEDDLASGRLETVLAPFTADEVNLYAVRAAGAEPPRRVKALMEFLAERL